MATPYEQIKESAINYTKADDKIKNNEIIALFALTQCKNMDEFQKVYNSIPEKFKSDKDFAEMVDYKKSELSIQKPGRLDQVLQAAKERKNNSISQDGRTESYDRNK